MANFVVALGYNSTSSPLHETPRDVPVMYNVDKIFDLSSTAVVASTYQNNYYTALTSVVSGDTIDVLPVPTNTLVLLAGLDKQRAATANTNGTIAVALVAPATTMIAATSVSATGILLSSPTWTVNTASSTASGAIGYIVSSTNGTTVRVTVGTAVPDAKLRVFAVLMDVSAITTRVN